MAEPRDFRILTNLRDALAAISIEAGYFVDVGGRAVRLDPNQDVEAFVRSEDPDAPPPQRPFILLELVGVETTPFEKPLHDKRVLAVRVHWVGDSDPLDDESWIRTRSRAAADIARAVNVDIERGGDAIDTRIVNEEIDTITGAEVWLKVDLVINAGSHISGDLTS